MKFKHYVVAAILALTSITSISAAEISDKDFNTAIEKFLKTDVEEGRRVYEHARTVYRQRLGECEVE